MQPIYYNNTNHSMRHTGNIVDLNEYRYRQAIAEPMAAEGLPPLPRREHRCPLGVRFSDLISMSMVAMTIMVTGMVVAFL